MATEKSRRLLTYEDYAALPDDGKKYELIHGELILCPSASFRHQALGTRVLVKLGVYLEAHPETGVVIYDFDVNPEPHETVRPDLLVFTSSRPGIYTNRKATEVPDIVGEILSRNYPYDLREKKQLYADHGAKEFWAFHQDRPRVQVFHLIKRGEFGPPRILKEGDSLATDLLPGFQVSVSELYRGLPG